MEIKEFAEVMAREIRNITEDVEIDVQTITKNNGVELTGIRFKPVDSCVAPMLYMEGFFEEYNQGTPIVTLADKAKQLYEQSLPQKDAFDVEFFTDYEQVRPHLSAKLVNYFTNKEMFENTGIMHQIQCRDLAIVPMVKISNSVIGEGTITITRDHVDKWGIDDETLWTDVNAAIQNTNFEVKTMGEVLGSMMGGMPGDAFDELPILVVSNKESVQGAIGMLSHEVMAQSCKRLDAQELFIIPSSIHEVLVMENTPETVGFGQMIREVNATSVSPQEVLSDHGYIYKQESDEYVSFDKYAERKAMREILKNAQ